MVFNNFPWFFCVFLDFLPVAVPPEVDTGVGDDFCVRGIQIGVAVDSLPDDVVHVIVALVQIVIGEALPDGVEDVIAVEQAHLDVLQYGVCLRGGQCKPDCLIMGVIGLPSCEPAVSVAQSHFDGESAGLAGLDEAGPDPG